MSVYSELTVLEALCDFHSKDYEEQLDIAQAIVKLDFIDMVFLYHISHGLSPGTASKRTRQPQDIDPQTRLLRLCNDIAAILNGGIDE